VLEEVAAGQPLLELLEREEVVVAPVDLARPRLARRGRDRQLEAGQPLAQPPDERALAYARRSGYDEQAQNVRALAAQE
jgi:hypothetical protein